MSLKKTIYLKDTYETLYAKTETLIRCILN